jgi:hypothetical protein
VAGVVIDGAVRDSEAIRELGFPMFAAGLNPNGPDQERGRPPEPPDLDRRRHRACRATWSLATPMA